MTIKKCKTMDLMHKQLVIKLGANSSRELQVIDVLFNAINKAGISPDVIDEFVKQDLVAEPNQPLNAFIVPCDSNHRVSYLMAAKNKKDLKERLKVSSKQASKSSLLPRYDINAVRVLSAPDLVWNKEGTFGEWSVYKRIES